MLPGLFLQPQRSCRPCLQLIHKDRWRDKQEREIIGKDGGSIMLTNLERAAKLAYLIEVAMQRKKEQEAIEDKQQAEQLLWECDGNSIR